VHVSGLQTVLKDNEELATIEKLVIPMMENPLFAGFIKPWNVAKAIEKRANLEDEGLFLEEDEAQQQMQQQQQQQQQAVALQQGLQQSQLALQQSQREIAQRAQALKEQQFQLDAQQAQIDLAMKQVEALRGTHEDEADRLRLMADLATAAEELQEIKATVAQKLVQTATDAAMTEAQIQKILAGIEAQERKLDIQARLVEVQAMAARRQAHGEGSSHG
jgi:hypothetical protein